MGRESDGTLERGRKENGEGGGGSWSRINIF